MFQSARFKLTLWYVIISMTVSIVFSVVLFSLLHRELARGFRRREFFQEQLQGPLPFNTPQFNNEFIEAAEIRIKLQLIYANLLVLGIAAIAGYFLAGRTLKPIKEMVDEQNRFIADASHEFRTPLTALKTALEVNMRDHELTLSQAREVLKENLNDVNRLKKLSDNLLTMIKLQRFDNKKRHERLSLKKILNKAVTQVSYLAKEKNISIKTVLSEVFVWGDEDSLVELFIIFLDNAIKYSRPDTSISVKIRAVDAIAEIIIKDQGAGINKKDLPYIFNRFYRADKSRSHGKIDGYGLGLAIAKEIIENHEGSVSVESTIYKGTTFIIHLPHAK